jgi:hypothetical protein
MTTVQVESKRPIFAEFDYPFRIVFHDPRYNTVELTIKERNESAYAPFEERIQKWKQSATANATARVASRLPELFGFEIFVDTLNRAAPAVSTEVDRREFLDWAYQLDAYFGSRHAVKWVIDKLDSLLAGSSDGLCECDLLLSEANVEKLSNSSLVTFLGMTYVAKDKLQHRNSFYRRAWHAVAIRRGDEGAEKLLSRYK